MNNQAQVIVLPDKSAVQQAAAERIVAFAAERVAMAQSFSIALSGGSTPGGLYQLLAQEPFRSRIAWEHVSVLWGDERYVPLDHEDSNYLLARETLLDHVPIPPERVYSTPTHHADPQAAADAYARQVQTLLDQGQGQLDLLLMGMGPDGHTASLFPHHPGLEAPEAALVIPVDNSPKPPPLRLTLTQQVINRGREILFLVTGDDKAEAVKAVLQGPPNPQKYPSQLIRAEAGTLIWMLDEAAAALLDT